MDTLTLLLIIVGLLIVATLVYLPKWKMSRRIYQQVILHDKEIYLGYTLFYNHYGVEIIGRVEKDILNIYISIIGWQHTPNYSYDKKTFSLKDVLIEHLPSVPDFDGMIHWNLKIPKHMTKAQKKQDKELTKRVHDFVREVSQIPEKF